MNTFIVKVSDCGLHFTPVELESGTQQAPAHVCFLSEKQELTNCIMVHHVSRFLPLFLHRFFFTYFKPQVR